MKFLTREYGRIPNTHREMRRVSGRASYGVISTPDVVKSYTIVSGDWTADGDMYYVDITHSKRSVEYFIQLNDDNTGEDIFPERINRRLDLDKCRIWMSIPPASITVILY